MNLTIPHSHPRIVRRTALAALVVLSATACDLEDDVSAGVRQSGRGPSGPADLQADLDPEFGSTTDEGEAGDDTDLPPTVVCGDGVVDVGELCDPGVPSVCGPDSTLMFCAATCNAFTLVSCSLCGNGVIDPGESCDGADLVGESCATQGFFSGALQCSQKCQLDVSACHDCGDGVADASELCDGADLKGHDCQSFGYAAGALACQTACVGFDVSQCNGTNSGCCTAGTACTNATTLACVCAIDPTCCEGTWTEACVAAASASCGAQCS